MALSKARGFSLLSLMAALVLIALLSVAILPSLKQSERSLDARILASDLRLASNAGLDAYRLGCDVNAENLTLSQLVTDGRLPLPIAQRLQQSTSLSFEADSNYFTTVVSGLTSREASTVTGLIGDARLESGDQVFIRLYSGSLQHWGDAHLVEYTSLWGAPSC